jgi:hypothetical protein
MERRGRSAWDGQCDRPGSGDEERWRKHTVVRPDEESLLAFDGQRTARRSDARIHDRDVNCAGRKSPPVSRDGQAPTLDVLGRDVMGDVDHDRLGSARHDHALHLGDVAVGRAEVGEQRDDRHDSAKDVQSE